MDLEGMAFLIGQQRIPDLSPLDLHLWGSLNRTDEGEDFPL